MYNIIHMFIKCAGILCTRLARCFSSEECSLSLLPNLFVFLKILSSRINVFNLIKLFNLLTLKRKLHAKIIFNVIYYNILENKI